MPVLPAILLAALLVANAAPAQGAKTAPRKQTTAVTRAVIQKQADMTVLCVRQRALPKGLTAKQRAMASRVSARLRAGQSAAAVEAEWKRLIQGIRTSRASVDVNALVMWVMRESYLESVQDLRDRADRVRFYNDTKRQIRSHIQETKALQSRSRGKRRVMVQTLRLNRYAKDAPATAKTAKRLMQRDEIQNYIAAWEKRLTAAGDDAQLANVDLQNALQKQQQTMQIMSNMSKALHDTAMAMIRNLR